MRLHPLWAAVGLFLSAFPLFYLLNTVAALLSPPMIAVLSIIILSPLFVLIYLPNRSYEDPLLYVLMVLCFIAGTDAVIALEKDGYTSSFADFYIREDEPYLGTAYGIMISYWHAVVAEEQNKNLFQRPMDLGLVVLDCPANSCFDYVYLQEPYLRDPVAYPKIQMLVYLFYVLPYFCISIYALLVPGCTWMGDWALVFAERDWWFVVLCNVAYAVGPQILAYRCLYKPAFFCNPVFQSKEKKNQ
ncbi:hypothetical protein E2320_022030 [Naja naja]|nr:hypothetical protein E2320_022030 [Naja naja]